MLENIMSKIEIKVDQKGRMTLPEKIKKHLGMAKDDDVWFEITPNGRVIIGRIEVKKKIID